MKAAELDRFLPKFVPEPTSGCWLWTAGVGQTNGYGKFRCEKPTGENSTRLAHRVSYEHFVGPIAPGLDVDHICATKLCVNPSHLRAIPSAVNAGKANTSRTHCSRGHAFADDNLRIARWNGREWRVCRACKALRKNGLA